MVKFARDCLYKIGQVTSELALELGEDTNDLRMRVGLHSGPTTAGVLRGIKGRFQLFGDTVNTASRMESTGMPGRIQISQTTADELLSRGKGHWLTAREDTVDVKGKGKMQTYYVNADAAQTNTTRHSSGDSSDRGLALKKGLPRVGVLPGIADSNEDDVDSFPSEAAEVEDDEREIAEEILLERQLKGYLVRRDNSDSV